MYSILKPKKINVMLTSPPPSLKPTPPYMGNP